MTLLRANALHVPLADNSVHCCVTSPPYFQLRDYGIDGQLGLEATPDAYVANMVAVFREVRRVLRKDATCWLNLGDSYSDKQLVGIPWRVAFALQADGWWLRSEITWAKKAPMPESVTDRPTSATEKVFLLAKAARYFYDAEAVREELSPTASYGGTYRTQTKIDASRHDNGYINAIGKTIIPNPSGRNMRNWWLLGPAPFSDWGETSRLVPVAMDERDDDTIRITSPDCPVHGDRPAQVAIPAYGGHASGSQSHNGRSDARHVQEPLFDSVPTDQSLDVDCSAQSSDSLRLPCDSSATDHSTQSHRMDHDPVTSQPCTPCDRTTCHTDGTQASPVSCLQNPDTGESNTSTDDFDDHQAPRTAAHNTGKTSLHHSSASTPPECTCSFYRKVTEKSTHFATYPPALVEPCILAGTSARGVCPECGAPWKRVVEHGDSVRIGGGNGNLIGHATGPMDRGGNGQWDVGHMPTVRLVTTIGWQPTCTCNAGEPVPATVLDPFIGSGTTGAVATSLGRRFVGLDLSAAYLHLAEQRLAKAQPALLAVGL